MHPFTLYIPHLEYLTFQKGTGLTFLHCESVLMQSHPRMWTHALGSRLWVFKILNLVDFPRFNTHTHTWLSCKCSTLYPHSCLLKIFIFKPKRSLGWWWGWGEGFGSSFPRLNACNECIGFTLAKQCFGFANILWSPKS